MRWIIGLTFAGFIGILCVAFVYCERANPQIIDVDPVAMDAHVRHVR